MRPTRMVLAVLAVVVGLAGCGDSFDENAPVPANAWPQMEDVEVIRSNGFRGQDCCEVAQEGGRVFYVESTAPGPTTDTVSTGFADAGWAPYTCTHQTVCFHHDTYVAIFQKPTREQRRHGVDLVVTFERDAIAGA